MFNGVALEKAFTMMGIALPLMFLMIGVMMGVTVALRKMFPATSGQESGKES